MDKNNVPIGFAFALAQDPTAMERFATLPKDKQADILRQAHGVSSREEMQALVQGLSAQA